MAYNYNKGMNQENIQFNEDEIDLMGYVKVLLKRKRLILGIFLGMTILAGVLSFLLPKVYKIDTSLEVGRIEQEVVEPPWQVVQKIESDVYGIQIREKLGIPERKYPKIKVENPVDTRLAYQPVGTSLVIIKIESSKTQQAKNILNKIDNLVLEEHQEKIEAKKELLEKDIERLTAKITSSEEEKKNLEAKVEALQKVLPYQETPGSQFALFDTKEKLETKKREIEDLYLQVNSLKRSLEDIQQTKIVKNPTVSEKPVRPKLLLNIVIAAIFGLFTGVFLAFGKEWWEKNKKN